MYIPNDQELNLKVNTSPNQPPISCLYSSYSLTVSALVQYTFGYILLSRLCVGGFSFPHKSKSSRM